MTRFGYNVLGDAPGIRSHLTKINPGAMLYFQHEIGEALWCKARFPNCNVVVRFWPDSDTHKLYPQPEHWVYAHRDLIGTGIIVQTTNEPGFSDEVISWHERLLTYLINSKTDLRVGILGLSVGTPRPEELSRANNLFRLAAMARDRVYLVLHEYYGGVVTSGFIGGHPDNAGVAPGQPGGTNLIPFAAWPSNPQSLTMWHVGRYKFLQRHLRSVGIPMPPVLIGEFGADYLGDIDGFLRGLHSTAGQYDIVDGWRDLQNDWRNWYGIDPGDVYMRMAAYADYKIYDEDVVGILFFAWGNDGNWKQYQTNPDITPWVEAYAAKTQPAPVPTPEPEPEPTPEPPKDRSDEFRAYMQKALDNWE